MEKLIIKIMDKDHKKIIELLNEFVKEFQKNQKNSINSFNRFKWNLDKHFFIEEKVIFNAYDLDNEKTNNDIQEILSQHLEIMNIISGLEDNINDDIPADTKELSRKLITHAKFEDEVFYPSLDEELSDEQKQEIIAKIKEIVME